MADETATNGVEDQTAENIYDSDRTAELSRKMEALEREKQKLAAENDESRERIKRMTIEIEKMKSGEEETRTRLREMEIEVERSEEAKKATGAIAARAASLETEVERLRHDLIQAMTEAEEANFEIGGLNQVLAEKGARIEVLETEVESLKAAKAESEKRVKELERKVGVLEAREVEEKSKKVRVEEEARERIEEKEKEIGFFKKKIGELESVKSRFESAAREAEEGARVLESKVVELQKELKEKAIEAVNGAANAVKEILEEGERDDERRSNLQWRVVAGSAGAVVVGAALLCVFHGRRQ